MVADIGLCADVGTLARLPKVIGSQSRVRELCLTGREFDADEAAACGLVSRRGSRDALQREAAALAATIAAKIPLAIAGTKANLLFASDHGVAGGQPVHGAVERRGPAVRRPGRGRRREERAASAGVCALVSEE